MKTQLLAICMAGTSVFAQMPSLSVQRVYTGPDSSIVMDYIHRHAAMSIGKNVIQIDKFDSAYNASILHRDTLIGDIVNIFLNVSGDSVAALIHTDQRRYYTIITPGPNGYHITTSWTANPSNVQIQIMNAWRTPYGISFMYRYGNAAAPPNAPSLDHTLLGSMNYRGNVFIGTDISASQRMYMRIISDQWYHYLVYADYMVWTNTYNVYVEKRLNNAQMTNVNNANIVGMYNTNVILTDIKKESDSTFTMILSHDMYTQAIRKEVFFSNLTFWEATLQHSINPMLDRDAAVIAHPDAIMFNNTIVRHSSATNGVLQPIDSIRFDPMYRDFRTTHFVSNYFIMSGTLHNPQLPDDKAVKLMLTEYNLTRRDSLELRGDTLNSRYGEYAANDSTYVIFGATSTMVGPPKGKVVFIKLRHLTTTVDEAPYPEESLQVYPNPVTHEMYVTSPVELTTIQIYDIIGRLLYEEEVNSTSLRIQMMQFAAGTYILAEKGNGKRVKFIKL